MRMHNVGPKKSDARQKLFAPTGVLIALIGAGVIPVDALASCTAIGTAVTCTATTNNYSNGANNLIVTVAPGATVSATPSLLPGAALSLTGSGVTLINDGTIDPALNGLIAAQTGVVIGNTFVPTSSVVNVTNAAGAVMNGSATVVGSAPALEVHNGIGGTTNITNAGAIGTTAGAAAGTAVVTTAGGAQTHFTNAAGGSIGGSVSLGAVGTAGAGNTFSNAGSVTGNVSLGGGLGSVNTFDALAGSSVSGSVNGGAGGVNTLNLQQLSLIHISEPTRR